MVNDLTDIAAERDYLSWRRLPEFNLAPLNKVFYIVLSKPSGGIRSRTFLDSELDLSQALIIYVSSMLLNSFPKKFFGHSVPRKHDLPYGFYFSSNSSTALLQVCTER